MKISYFLFMLIATVMIGSCVSPENKKANETLGKKSITPPTTVKRQVMIDIVPYNDVPSVLTYYTYNELKKIYSNIRILPSIPLPNSALNYSGKRYRADSLIRQLWAQTPPGHVSIGITTKDISYTKGKIADWGVFGLSYIKRGACVASTFRIKGKDIKGQFFKVAIHELGHTQDLEHCNDKTCFMRDAQGKNHMNEEKAFCPKCRKVLMTAGWSL